MSKIRLMDIPLAQPITVEVARMGRTVNTEPKQTTKPKQDEKISVRFRSF